MLEQVHLAYTGYLLLELRACRAGIYDQDGSMLRMKEEEEQMGTSVLPPDACVWGRGKNGYLLMLACGEAVAGTAPFDICMYDDVTVCMMMWHYV